MKYTKIRLYTSSGYAESLSNLWPMNKCSIVELKDAVEKRCSGQRVSALLRQAVLPLK